MPELDLRDGRPLVFVTVGTDFHPFDRLVHWLDEWMIEGGGAARSRVFIQSGTSAEPRHAAWAELITRDEMHRFLGSAAAVVCHGGPASITECRSAGVLPIVVPRVHLFGEHVDDHQVVFTRHLAELGKIRLADTKERLLHLLDDALAAPDLYRIAPGAGDYEATVAEFARVVDALGSQDKGPHRRWLR